MINVRVPQKSSFNCSKIRQSTEKRPSCRHPEIQLKYCSCAYPVDQQGFSTVLLFFLYHKKKNDAVEKPCWSKYSNFWWEYNYLAFDSITYYIYSKNFKRKDMIYCTATIFTNAWHQHMKIYFVNKSGYQSLAISF